jgi:hypothetical protein
MKMMFHVPSNWVAARALDVHAAMAERHASMNAFCLIIVIPSLLRGAELSSSSDAA